MDQTDDYEWTTRAFTEEESDIIGIRRMLDIRLSPSASFAVGVPVFEERIIIRLAKRTAAEIQLKQMMDAMKKAGLM